MNDAKHLELGDKIVDVNEPICPGDVFCSYGLSNDSSEDNDVVWMVVGPGRTFPSSSYHFTILVLRGDEVVWNTGEVFDLMNQTYELYKQRVALVQPTADQGAYEVR